MTRSRRSATRITILRQHKLQIIRCILESNPRYPDLDVKHYPIFLQKLESMDNFESANIIALDLFLTITLQTRPRVWQNK